MYYSHSNRSCSLWATHLSSGSTIFRRFSEKSMFNPGGSAKKLRIVPLEVEWYAKANLHDMWYYLSSFCRRGKYANFHRGDF